MSFTVEEGAAQRSHLVGIFEDDCAFATSVGDFLAGPAQRGDVAIAIVTEAHRLALAAELRGRGLDLEETVTMLDASAALELFMSKGRLNRDAFHAQMGALLSARSAADRSICIFGEMVALLWDAGDVNQAIELESLWNELGEVLPFSLYCGYSMTSVCATEHAESLRRMCQLHDDVFGMPYDPGGDSRRTSGRRARFEASVYAPLAVRRFVASALAQWALPDWLIKRAVLVSSELAANAVIHTGASFWATIKSNGPAIRLEIRDSGSPVTSRGDPVLVVSRERGLGIVSSFASRWGTYGVGDGKVVWAEFDSGELP